MVGKPTGPLSSEPPKDGTDREARHQEDAGPLVVERLRKDDGRALLLYTLPADARQEQ